MIAKLKSTAIFALDIIVPRFITEDVALRYVGDDFTTDWTEWSAYEIACSMSDVETNERFDGVATVDAFQFLGFGIAYRIGNFRPWGQA